jgi:superoxide dismutase, Cu-Zn family
MSRTRLPLLVVAALASLLAGCASHTPGPTPVTSAVCVLRGTAGNEGVSGTVRFTQQKDHVLVEARVAGLAPGSHGFHVHQLGDISGLDGKSAGGHFNPMNHPHSAPDAAKRHVGDLGNLIANASGVAVYRRMDTQISLDPTSAANIVGRAIIVHAGQDDLKSQPTGAAGARVASGVIGVGPN